jgi:hypothetical protein
LLQVGERHKQEFGDKTVVVDALLLLAVVAVVSAEFPGIIRAARTRRGPVGFAVVID